MSSTKKGKPLHPRNLHSNGYDIKKLASANKNLTPYIIETPAGKLSVDFANPAAVLELNKALVKVYYQVDTWAPMRDALCPAVPGRADYIHYLADLLATDNEGVIPRGDKVRVLDIGTGSSCIYPILGVRLYSWSFVATDIDMDSINHCLNLAKANNLSKKQIDLRFQIDPAKIFAGIIEKDEKFDAVICNPPFFKSREDNWQKSTRKFKKLNKNESKTTVQNFGGHPNELWCEGGERQFVRNMIYESMKYKEQLGWVTSLISDKENLKPLIAVLEYNKAAKVEVINTTQGNKTSRILAWKW